jgi:hypothetical protein
VLSVCCEGGVCAVSVVLVAINQALASSLEQSTPRNDISYLMKGLSCHIPTVTVVQPRSRDGD